LVEGNIMWRRAVLTSTLVAAQLHAAAAAERGVNCRFWNITTRSHMERAVQGAMRRLQEPECQRVLQEFSTRDGVRLQEILDRDRVSAAEFVSRLTFIDGSLTPQCQKRQDIAAFTAPGLRLIYICGDRFVQDYSNLPRAADVLIIHETLHALGLGENPPSSGEITARVTRRCT
jgi:hypothetical protein